MVQFKSITKDAINNHLLNSMSSVSDFVAASLLKASLSLVTLRDGKHGIRKNKQLLSSTLTEYASISCRVNTERFKINYKGLHCDTLTHINSSFPLL